MNNIILAVIAVCIVIVVLIVVFILYRRQSSQSQEVPSSVTPATESPDLLELEKAHKEVMTALAVESRTATYDLAEASMELSIARRRAQTRQRRDQANNLQGP